MRIDWQSRVKNRTFWLTLIPAVLLLAQAIGTPFGYKWDFVVLNRQLADIINALFMVLSVIGVINNPTTGSLKD